MSEKNTLKNYCNECDKGTNHIVLGQHTWHSAPKDYDHSQYHKLVKCLGCDDVSLRIEDHDLFFTVQNNDGEWIPDITIKNYPKKLQNHKDIEQDYLIPELVKNIYKEVILTLQEDAKILASLGLRACIEAICNHLEITGRNLEIRINRLVTLGFISKRDAELLHAIRFMGNDSAHEIKAPKESALKIALKIVEHLLQSVFILPERAKGSLDTIIDNYQLFEKNLGQHLSNFEVGEEYPILHFFEKDRRRLTETISALENTLIENIQSGAFTLLKIGKEETNKEGKKVQFFIKN